MRERLKANPAEEVIRYLFEPALQAEVKRSFETIIQINQAHLSMLVRQGIVQAETAQKIFEAIKMMEEQGPEQLELDPNLEELYFNMEAFIIKQVGVNVGGQLHTGRSRNDLYATVTRMNTRKYILSIMESINTLRYSLLRVAESHVNVVMSGYTHLQPAEPITFAHYLSAVLHALNRDYMRVEQALRHINLLPLGAGAMASTTFPINRKQTAELLGFDDILQNSLDGVASRDYILETLSALNILMLTLSRFCHDLYIWSTEEFAIVEVGDSVAACSSIMPQKKNPITLEHIKAKAAHVLGILVSASASIKNTPYGHCRDVSAESIAYAWNAFHEVEASLQLLRATVETLKIKGTRMLERVTANYSTVTELANTLVRETDVSFREAHHVVAHLVAEALEQGREANEINSLMVKNAAMRVLGRELPLSEESIKIALNPILNVQSKSVPGGPAPTEVQTQLDCLKENIDSHSDCLEQQKAAIDAARKLLEREVNQLLSLQIGGS
ncbi:argininosuccinate lyase [Brevibacillus sp. B_LB10_24]|uniref:argininosuccinate lyase n=1 Tax=Brevibacillus sp. B_LB10_24 TaxID=3380645 RepID=UPI0038BA94ED